jgi:DNA-binding NarL/FixJ family response regulator
MDPQQHYTFDGKFMVCSECQARTRSTWPSHHPGCSSRKGVQGLTARETEVAIGLSMGETVKDIAGRLALSPKTVEAHRFNVYRKLGIHSLAKLTRIVVAEIEGKIEGKPGADPSAGPGPGER